MTRTLTEEEAREWHRKLERGEISVAEVKREFPKASMIFEYVRKHYPDDTLAISNHKMLPQLIFNDEYSNSEIEEMIDKLAIFNGWQKWGPVK